MEVKKDVKAVVIDVVLLVLSALLCVGSKVIFHACNTDGDMVMSCHWAEQMSAALGALMAIMAVLSLIMGASVRKGIHLAQALTAVLTFITPGILINLCMMDDMRCRAVMRPTVMIMSGVIFIVAVLSIILDIRREKND